MYHIGLYAYKKCHISDVTVMYQLCKGSKPFQTYKKNFRFQQYTWNKA